MRRNRRQFPKLSGTSYAIIAGLGVLYFIYQKQLWHATWIGIFAAICLVLAVLIAVAIVVPLLWYVIDIVFIGLWRARKLRLLRYRRALRQCNFREDAR